MRLALDVLEGDEHAYAKATELASRVLDAVGKRSAGKAREKLLAAYAKEPGNPYVKNNLDLLDESIVEKRGAR